MITYNADDQSVTVVKDGHSTLYRKAIPVFDENGQQKYLEEDPSSPAVIPEIAPEGGMLKVVCDAVWALPASSGKAEFSTVTAAIRYRGQTYTPDDYTDIAEADVKAFAEAIYTYNNGEQAKVYEALQMDIIEQEREPEPLTPEQEKELARRQIIKTFEDGVKALTSGYTDNEVKSWYAKRRESEIILSGSEEPTPTIDAICEVLGTDRADYAKRINQKVQAYGSAYGALEATMKRDLAALEE